MNRIKKIIHASEVYRRGYTGKNIGIAVLDTGVYLHPDLEHCSIIFRDFVHGRKLPYDDNGHGTHIAGILAGSGKSSNGMISGMAPGASLIVLKVLDHNGSGDSNDVISALEWVENNYRKYHIRLLNFSVGFVPGSHLSEQKQLIESLEHLWDLGITIVTAAGNNGPKEASITVPGISRKLLTVGAYDGPQYSGSGPTPCCIVKPEVLAPGTNVLSLDVSGDGYAFKSGTSMSAPIVCGGIALAMEKYTDIPPEKMKLLLFETVYPRGYMFHKKSWGLFHVDNLMMMGE